LLLLLAKKFGWECGSFVQVVQGVHLPGSVPFKFFFPMFFISLVSAQIKDVSCSQHARLPSRAGHLAGLKRL
jgi:hypothetical protein